MTSLAAEAAKAFLACTKRSYFAGVASWGQTVHRLQALMLLTDPSDGARRIAQRVLAMDELDYLPDGWSDDDRIARAEVSGAAEATTSSWIDEDGKLWFYPASRTGMSDWRFHVYDDDFFPSVPHGHHRMDRRRKLDSYLGWVYIGSGQVGRVARSLIAALWNDDKFRAMAAQAISYYLQQHPAYTGWRVANPMRLPRRS